MGPFIYDFGGKGGVNQILTFADRGEEGSKMAKKNADIINERPLCPFFVVHELFFFKCFEVVRKCLDLNIETVLNPPTRNIPFFD